jgi:hypothetical protein
LRFDSQTAFFVGMAYKYPLLEATEGLKLAVWSKGLEVPGLDPVEWRYDICGKLMKYRDHGSVDSDHGWEIDHILPVSLKGQTFITNLQPLHWTNNRAKGDTYPWNFGH